MTILLAGSIIWNPLVILDPDVPGTLQLWKTKSWLYCAVDSLTWKIKHWVDIAMNDSDLLPWIWIGRMIWFSWENYDAVSMEELLDEEYVQEVALEEIWINSSLIWDREMFFWVNEQLLQYQVTLRWSGKVSLLQEEQYSRDNGTYTVMV